MIDEKPNLHRRRNPLTNSWVLVSPHRNKRPWQGQREEQALNRNSYDPGCYLCPGNKRAGEEQNPSYDQTFVFDNDYPALIREASSKKSNLDEQHPLFVQEEVSGTCRVICFSPKHNESLAQMKPKEIQQVIELWKAQSTELGKQYKWVQIFENKGSAMGCSNPHPHGQIWASNHLPDLVQKEDQSQESYLKAHSKNMLADYLDKELQDNERIVTENESWAAIVPYWAEWPFETIVLPKKKVARLDDLNTKDSESLAEVLKVLLSKYDNLFQCSFPYSMGWHQAPHNEDDKHWLLHAHFYPPLLRGSDVKKFMVGYEMMAESQRDLTPELAAKTLRELPTKHYLD